MDGQEQQETIISPDIEPILNQDEITQVREAVLDTEYFDAKSMAPLSPVSVAAIARLRAYKPPPFTVWDRLPLSRRAAVLILLFADRRGDLRVVITMRSTSLRNYSGHAAFPGGKADNLTETAWETARREAHEEIGLPSDDANIPSPFRIEHLCQLPFSLAKTALVVRPCVAFLHADATGENAPTVGDNMIPRLDAKEVAAVFSAPFHNFLRSVDERVEEGSAKGEWYSGSWTDWHEGRWRMHNFYVRVDNQKVARPSVRAGGQVSLAEEEEEDEQQGKGPQRYKVFGMTARMLVDAARVAYGEEPEFEHNDHIGDESMIESLEKMGRLGEKVPGGPDLTDADLKNVRVAAAKAAGNAKM